MGKEFVLEEAQVEVTEETPPEKPAGEEETHEEPTPEEGAEEGAEPGGKKPAAEKGAPAEPKIPKEAEPHLARMRRAHERELKIVKLQARNEVLEELVKSGVKVPAVGDGKPTGGTGTGDEFVFEKPRPMRDTFEGSETEYEDALADWREERRESKQQFNARQGQQAEAKKQGDALFEKMHTEALTRYPDYDDKIEESKEKGIQVNQRVAQAVQRFGGKYMPDLIYHFATHPEEVSKLNALPDPFEAVEDLRDTFARASKAKPHTKVPPPPPRLEADTSTGGANEFDEGLSPDQRIEAGKARRAREESAGKKK